MDDVVRRVPGWILAVVVVLLVALGTLATLLLLRSPAQGSSVASGPVAHELAGEHCAFSCIVDGNATCNGMKRGCVNAGSFPVLAPSFCDTLYGDCWTTNVPACLKQCEAP